MAVFTHRLSRNRVLSRSNAEEESYLHIAIWIDSEATGLA